MPSDAARDQAHLVQQVLMFPCSWGSPPMLSSPKYGWQQRHVPRTRVAAFPLVERGPGFPSTSPADGVCLLSYNKKGKYLVQSALRQRQTYGRFEASLGAWENTVKALQRLLDVGLPLS